MATNGLEFVYILLLCMHENRRRFESQNASHIALFSASQAFCSQRITRHNANYAQMKCPAAIASSRTRLATLTGAMYKTSQCELRSLRVNSGMLNVIRIVTYYTLPPLESPTSSWIAMAFWR